MSRKSTLVTQLGPNGAIPLAEFNSAAPFSLSTDFSTPATVIRFLDNCSYQINVTTTDSSGTFAVEVSNDYYVNEGNDSVVMNPGKWIPLTLAGGTPTVSAGDTLITVNLNQLPFYAVRLSYNSTTAGTGICRVFITDKVLGA